MPVFLKLLLERCVRAGAAAAIGVTITRLASPDFDPSSAKTIAIAAGAAAVSAVLSILSQFVGDPESTSFTRTTVDR